MVSYDDKIKYINKILSGILRTILEDFYHLLCYVDRTQHLERDSAHQDSASLVKWKDKMQ